MKHFAVILGCVLMSSAIAQDALVMPVSPVQTIWTIHPVVIDLLSVLAQPQPDPVAIRALVVRLSPEAVWQVALATMKDPTAFCAFISALTPAQTASLAVQLQQNPSALKAVVALLDPEKIAAVRVELFLTNIDAWEKLGGFLEVNPAPAPGRPRLAGNWLDAARDRLRQMIAKEGYSPAILADAEALMEQAKQPAVRGKLNQIKTTQ